MVQRLTLVASVNIMNQLVTTETQTEEFLRFILMKFVILWVMCGVAIKGLRLTLNCTQLLRMTFYKSNLDLSSFNIT
jgi:hypothetical protein